MVMRRDPGRVNDDRRAAILDRFIAVAHVSPDEADLWVSSWERRAEAVGLRPGSYGYWDTGLRWIGGRRAHDATDDAAQVAS